MKLIKQIKSAFNLALGQFHGGGNGRRLLMQTEGEVLRLVQESPEMLETVICAAIKLPDGFIIRGHRHNDCYRNLQGRPKYKGIKFDERIIEGFITSRNRFVDRKVGRKLQDAAGIKSVDKDGYRRDILFSEDLY